MNNPPIRENEDLVKAVNSLMGCHVPNRLKLALRCLESDSPSTIQQAIEEIKVLLSSFEVVSK